MKFLFLKKASPKFELSASLTMRKEDNMDKNTTSPIEIRLTRAGMKGKMDDLIKIKPTDETLQMFSILHHDKHSDKKYQFYESWDGVGAYLAQLFTVLPFDADPFERVQFSLPAYPSLMFKIQDLQEPYLMNRVWDMLDTTARGWPQTVQ